MIVEECGLVVYEANLFMLEQAQMENSRGALTSQLSVEFKRENVCSNVYILVTVIEGASLILC